METLWWTVFYVLLARVCKLFSKTVQLHSIVHCFVASVVSGVVFYQVIGDEVFRLDVYRKMISGVTPADGLLLRQVAFHSAGYFLGDTVDIYIDYRNVKRKEYVLHHLASVAGLCTVYYDSYISLWGLWLFEVGGVVHHIKHAAKVFKWPGLWGTAAELLYHSVYVSSRLLLFVNTSFSWLYMHQSLTPYMDIVCGVVVYVLVIQNSMWWYKNMRATKMGRHIQRSFTEMMVYSYASAVDAANEAYETGVDAVSDAYGTAADAANDAYETAADAVRALSVETDAADMSPAAAALLRTRDPHGSTGPESSAGDTGLRRSPRARKR